MFKRLPGSLPPDPVFPNTLEEHGIFINEKDQVRMIENPEESVRIRISKNERYNQMRNSSIHNIIMDEVTERLKKLGVEKLYLPQLTTEVPRHTQSVPIFVSNPKELKDKKRIVLIIPHKGTELEIFTFAGMFTEDGIEEASPIGFAKDFLKEGDEAPGFLFANTSQLLYSHRKNKAVSLDGWQQITRPSMIHPAATILPEFNLILGHEEPENHIKWLFEKLLTNPELVNPDAKIDIIAVRDSGASVIQYLSGNYDKYARQLSSMAFIHAFYEVDLVKNVNLRKFLADRARTWIWSEEAVNTPIVDSLANVNLGTLCPTFSGGEQHSPELIIIRAREAILDWLKFAYEHPEFINPEFTVVDIADDDSATEVMKNLTITPCHPEKDTATAESIEKHAKLRHEESKTEHGTCHLCGDEHEKQEFSKGMNFMVDWPSLKVLKSYSRSDSAFF